MDPPPELGLGQLGLPVGPIVGFRGQRHDGDVARLALAGPGQIAHRVERHAIEPARERRLALEAADRPAELDADVLGDVLGVRPIAAPFVGHAVDGVVVALHQARERRPVAAEGLLDQTVVAQLSHAIAA